MAYGKNSIIRPIDMKQEYSVYPIFHKIEYNHNQNVPRHHPKQTKSHGIIVTRYALSPFLLFQYPFDPIVVIIILQTNS
jgi:hypothetical protein